LGEGQARHQGKEGSRGKVGASNHKSSRNMQEKSVDWWSLRALAWFLFS